MHVCTAIKILYVYKTEWLINNHRFVFASHFCEFQIAANFLNEKNW